MDTSEAGLVDWRDLARNQDGVIARWQLLGSGLAEHAIRRLLRRRELVAVHPGVYVVHTGRTTWTERAWAAVLTCWPAALAGRSALPHPPEDKAITVVVARGRTIRAPRGVRVIYRIGYEQELGSAYPPRQRPAYAALDAVSVIKEEASAYALLAGLVQRSVLTPAVLLDAIGTRSRVSGRRRLLDLLEDLEAGACSVLEREYLRRVERAHHLPVGERQAEDRVGGTSLKRDVLYRDYGLIVELDGRAFHDNPQSRGFDSARDLAAAAARDLRTVRITMSQVLGDGACSTARSIGTLLRRGDWTGVVQPCDRCRTAQSAASQ